MLLIGVKENPNWLISRWLLTYPVGWWQILKACGFSSKDYYNIEVLIDDKVVPVKNGDDLEKLPESGSLSFPGLSMTMKTLVVITFYNQTDKVDVSVAKNEGEFKVGEYEKFNKSMSQYLNSIELSMYRYNFNIKQSETSETTETPEKPQ